MARLPTTITGQRLRGAGAAWLFLGVGWVVLGLITGHAGLDRFITGGIVATLGLVGFISGTVMVRRRRTRP